MVASVNPVAVALTLTLLPVAEDLTSNWSPFSTRLQLSLPSGRNHVISTGATSPPSILYALEIRVKVIQLAVKSYHINSINLSYEIKLYQNKKQRGRC